ncbi:hypothetical protein G7046_g4786 [Stylonectria norvegica]|nr:hypothetical protein G7046_g4786 [Stylonectria norvegica]
MIQPTSFTPLPQHSSVIQPSKLAGNPRQIYADGWETVEVAKPSNDPEATVKRIGLRLDLRNATLIARFRGSCCCAETPDDQKDHIDKVDVPALTNEPARISKVEVVAASVPWHASQLRNWNAPKHKSTNKAFNIIFGKHTGLRAVYEAKIGLVLATVSVGAEKATVVCL